MFSRKSFTFLATLLVLVTLFLLAGNFRNSDTVSDSAETEDLSLDPMFPDSFHVAKRGSFVRVKAAPALNPNNEKDFVFFVWFNAKDWPELEEQIFFVAKFSTKHPNRPGYSIGYKRSSDAVYPLVYWQDEMGRGRTYRFSEFPFVPGSWILLALSFQESRFLGLHGAVVPYTAKQNNTVIKPSLYGGYELDPPVIAASDSNLVIGAQLVGKFRGQVGPFGIFSGDKLADSLDGLLSQLIKEPLEIPSEIDNEDVLLWTIDGLEDMSSFNHKIENKEIKRARRKKRRNKDSTQSNE